MALKIITRALHGFLSGEEIRKPGGESIYYVTCGSDIPAAAIGGLCTIRFARSE